MQNDVNETDIKFEIRIFDEKEQVFIIKEVVSYAYRVKFANK